MRRIMMLVVVALVMATSTAVMAGTVFATGGGHCEYNTNTGEQKCVGSEV